MKRLTIIAAAFLVALCLFLVDFDRFSRTAVSIARSDTGRSITCDGSKPEKFYVELKRFFDDLKEGSKLGVSVVPKDSARRSWTFDVEVLPNNEVSIVTKGAANEDNNGPMTGSSSLGCADFLTSHVWAMVCYEYVVGAETSHTGSTSQFPDTKTEEKHQGEQDGGGQPATRSESK
jgi:hypothetical protein